MKQLGKKLTVHQALSRQRRSRTQAMPSDWQSSTMTGSGEQIVAKTLLHNRNDECNNLKSRRCLGSAPGWEISNIPVPPRQNDRISKFYLPDLHPGKWQNSVDC
ncbi:unnamed protein product [Polarella glacialis]|uniref:Uncharacterized protein n=1 Tax=Polarella glacialis TaxID=89957 RepID=A0A813ECB3_POLGL|nr:unnamed protein product [Polarella glacialis]CAE8695999.1 unnamed protein product [Polarella glacialis]